MHKEPSAEPSPSRTHDHGSSDRSVETDTVPRHLRSSDLRDQVYAMRLGLYVGLPVTFFAIAMILRAYTRDQISGLVALVLCLLAPAAAYGLIRLQLASMERASQGLLNLLHGASGQPALPGFSLEESLVLQDRIPEAIAAYRARIDATPGDIEARVRLGAVLAGPGRDAESAIATLLEARSAASSLAHEGAISAALMQLYLRSGNRSAMKAELARQARLFPSAASGVSALRQLRELTREDAAAESAQLRDGQRGPEDSSPGATA